MTPNGIALALSFILIVTVAIVAQEAQPLPTKRRHHNDNHYISPYRPYPSVLGSNRYSVPDPSRYNYYAPYSNYLHYYDNPPGTYYYNYPYGGYYNYRFARYGNYYRR